jgi:hypothetical protein
MIAAAHTAMKAHMLALPSAVPLDAVTRVSLAGLGAPIAETFPWVNSGLRLDAFHVAADL